MKKFYRFKNEALAALERSGKAGYLSTAEDWGGLELVGFGPGFGWAGEVSCMRTDDGDIFAWWEDELTYMSLINGVATFNADPFAVEDEDTAKAILAAGEPEEITDPDEFADARCKLDLNSYNPAHIYKCGDALFCLPIDF